MSDHLHTGPVQLFVTFVGIVVLWQASRLAAARLADSSNATVAAIGKGIGGVLTTSA